MKKGTGLLLVCSALVLIIIIIIVKSYSSLSTLNTDVKNRESDLNVQLTRKKEQISNLLENSKDLIIESDELINEIEKTSKIIIKGNIKEKSKNNDKLTSLLNQLLEKMNPEVLNNEEIKTSIEGLLSTEKRINTAKTNYNNVVDDYNSKVTGFPSSIIASIRGFDKKDNFEVTVEIKNIKEGE